LTLSIISTAAISVDPLTLSQELAPNETATQTLTISNNGESTLYWNIEVNDETGKYLSGKANSKNHNIASDFGNDNSFKNLELKEQPSSSQVKDKARLLARMEADGLYSVELGMANARSGGASPTQTDDATIRYDNGVNFDAIGPTSGGTFQVAAYWPAAMMAQYTGMKLAQVEFYINTVPVPCVIKIYGPGTPTSPGTLLYEETVFPTGLTWNIFNLAEQVEITGEDLWIGYEVTHPAGEYPAGCDAGPAIAGYGDMITLDGVVWAPLSGYGLDYNWNLVGYLVEGEFWLTISPTTGIVQPGETATVDVTFDATSLVNGNYNADIILTSNAVNSPEVLIPAQLIVSGGAPDISLSTDLLEFGSVAIGSSNTQTVTVSNTGYGLLEITETTFSNPDFSLITDATTINPGESAPFEIQFAPSVTGLISGVLSISSNDPDQPDISINLAGTGYLEAPQNLIANVVGHNVTLTWDQPFKNPSRGLLGYNIYRDGSQIDYSSITNFTDFNVPAGGHQYQVSAVYDEGESELTPAVSVLVGTAIIAVNPDLFEESLAIGASVSREIMITNTGDLPLTLDINLGSSKNLTTTDENTPEAWEKLKERMDADGLSGIELGIANARPGGASPTQTDDATVRYDNGVNFEAIGPTSGGTFQVAAYWPAATMAQYAGMKLQKVEMYINSVPSTCKIMVYGQGTPTSPGTLLYEETVFTVGLSWNLFTLSNEVDITGQDIWIGYEVTHSAGTYPAGCDVGPAIAGFGDMITLDGVQWAPLSGYGLDYNWNLAAYLITGGPAPTNDVGVQTILSPITGLNLSNETVKIRVKNFGTASQSNIPVSYTIDGGAAVTGTVAGPLASGATFDYTFAGAANLGTVGQTYVFNACTALAGDEIPGNNCKAASVTNELPIYCDASTTTQDEYISNVLFGSINNSSGWQGGVSDYTAISTTIEAGASEAMTIINGTPWASDIVYVWVDWNKDYVFGTGDEQYILSNIGGTGALFTGSVAVPVGQASGHYRMRIRMTYSTAPTPCGNASYGEIEDYTLVVEGVANWLTLNPTAGTIQPGESATVDVTFDATNLANGVYNTDITINSNAINAPQVIIPAQLTVSGGVPNISLSVGSLDFGTLKVGGTTTQTVAVSNTGYDVLEIIEATFSNPDFSLITGASTINPGESAPFEIIFAPSVTGLISGILTISSNDPDQTEVTIDLSGSAYLEVPQNLIANVVGHDVTLTWDHPFKDTSRGLLGYNIYRDGSLIGYSTITNYTDFNVSVGSHQYQVSAVYDEGESELTPAVSVLVGSPIIEVNPVSFEEYLAIETSITREMMVTNSGDLPLTFAVNTGYNRNFKTINENSEDELGNHKKSKVLGEPQIIKLGSANTKPGGPSPYQTDEATIRYDNNVNFDAIGLVYGGTFEVASLFPAVTMAQYAGLKLSKLEFYIKDLPNQCVIKIYGPGSGTTPGSLLYSEAVIAVGLSWNIINLSIPVDITGQDLWIGYEVTHDENTYPAGHDPGPAVAGFGDMIYIEGTWAPLSSYELNYNWNLAGYLIETPLNWLIVSPTSGTLLPGESATVDVTFNASNLTPDVYTAKINISSNDPNTPLIEIPVQLTVQTDETHVISINQGWSGISSYLIPTDSDVESILQPIISDLTILQSGTGIYWPDQNVNTIGSWDTHHGYMIKVANAVDLTITGVSENDRTLFLSEGWNLIPILSNYEVDVETLFNGINLEILKEVAGVRIYWPSMNVKSLNFVEPGKAYFLKMSSPDSITFPVKSLVATPQNPEVTAVASELTIEITSNTSWSVIENVAWFSVSPVSGSNNGTITVTFDENTSSSRVGQITITAAGGAPVVNVTLTQAGVWACGQTLNDTRDSKTYTTVQIGTQCWMAQNLNIGTMVPGGNEMVDDGTVEKYCYDNSEANCDVYGGLYQWDEMMEYSTAIGVQGICPTGWHLPSDAEWTALTTCLGGEDVAGGKMKETGTIEEGTGLWWSPNYVATNSSGFSALPGGSRYYDGALFSSIGYTGYWWSSTEVSITFARDRYLNNNLANVYGNDSDKGYGISVRCLRDASTTSTTPTVTTTSISNITQTTATSGGDVTSDGGAMVTERGVCWSTNANPTIADNRTFDGEGMGVFESNITDLAANTLFFVRAYATNNVGTAYGEEVSFTTLAGSGSTCGTSIIINHVAGDVAPVYKTVTYGIVTNIPGEPSKCWITSNLGADHQATTVSDATEPSAGWYWQFNRKQGYKHTGSVRTPNTTWISSISENSNWISTNDPCTLELGSGWRIPSYTEWSNVNSFGNWTNWNDPWNSDLKIHAAGYLNDSDGSMPGRGVLGLYWSSAQSGVTYGQFLVFMVGAGNSGMSWDPKARGIPLRCLRD
jgi:uncharacterized protein (TIGR02145 family)